MSTKLKIDNENAVLENVETGGDITVRAADDTTGDGGAVVLEGGDGDGSGSGGAVFIRPGYGGGSAPAIPVGTGVPEPAEFWFVDGDSTPGYVGLKAPDAVSDGNTGDGANTVWVLPEGDGTNGQVMITDGAGILSWTTPVAAPSGSYVETPMVADLDVASFDIIGTPPATVTSAGGNIDIIAGAGGATSGAGGTINITSGAASGGGDESGDITIESGASAGGNTGDILVQAGLGTDYATKARLRILQSTVDLFGASGGANDQGGGDVGVNAGTGFGAGAGGLAQLFAGPGGATGDGGAASVEAGDGGATSGDGGDVNVDAGSAQGSGNGGAVSISAGAGGALDGDGGNITITAGSAVNTAAQNSAGGDITFQAGANDGSSAAGDIELKGGDAVDTGRGGHIRLQPGTGTTQPAVFINPQGGTGGPGELRFVESGTPLGNYLGLKAPSSVVNDKVFEMSPKFKTVATTSDTVAEDDDVVLVDPVTAAGNVTLTLHSAANERFRHLNIKVISQSASFTVTVQRAGADTIDGATTYVFAINSQWASVTLANDKGTGWYVL